MLVLVLVLGCAAPSSWRPYPIGDTGLTAELPREPEVHRGHEGPRAQTVVAGVHTDDGRFEVAVFDLPRPLDDDEQAALLLAVERGIEGRPDVKSVERSWRQVGERRVRVLALALTGGRAGRWQLYFDGPPRMVQLSAVGPAGPDLEQGSERLFVSVLGE